MRRSLRAMGKPAPAYSDAAVERDAREAEAADLALSGRGRKRARTAAAAGPRPPPATATSIRNLDVDVDGLRRRFLGRVVPPLGGQVKRAVMEAASPGVSPTFSRMSGIQEWRNAIMLFVNVYGDGYKNSCVGGGVEITWFAQPRQWEGTPGVQRLVNCDGGEGAADSGGGGSEGGGGWLYTKCVELVQDRGGDDGVPRRRRLARLAALALRLLRCARATREEG